ncbi:hypothetical protein ACSXA9_15215 (plasmid) [Clostridium perfringens]|uniref:hypothetical protein n=1 Tax=Clostridium perfringens TaxID=1502 RepID=UPI001FB08F19|nr:hypothetical protein [Clostridium perfringens]
MAVIKYLPGKKSLKSQLKYLEKEGKTLEELKIGINCTSDNIEKEFNIVKELYKKKKENNIIITHKLLIQKIKLHQKKLTKSERNG